MEDKIRKLVEFRKSARWLWKDVFQMDYRTFRRKRLENDWKNIEIDKINELYNKHIEDERNSTD